MKHILAVILIISLYSALAEPPFELGSRHIQGTGPVEIDGLVYSQTYSFAELYNGFSNCSASDRWVCDDFVFDDNYYVTEMCVWMIWTGEQATQMNLVISEDDLLDSDPNTNTDVWVGSVPCINTFTGDSNWGYDIYETYCIINANVYPELDAGIHYYFETQAADVTDNSFILVSVHYIGDSCWLNDGSGVWQSLSGMMPYSPDLFFDFYGEPVSALEPETWGSIKTLF